MALKPPKPEQQLPYTNAKTRLPPTGASAGATQARQALAWLHSARFLTTAAQLQHLPETGLPELAFVGRSNSGKSTAINTLTQQGQLAYASNRPGRTQNINLFSLGKPGVHEALIADLPGYGYAAVPLADKHRWQQVMALYLVERVNLAALVLLCDSRRGLTELDDALLQLIAPRIQQGLPLLVLLTKADKLNRAEQAKALSIVRLQTNGADAMLFSATKRVGLEQAASWLLQRVLQVQDQIQGEAPLAGEPPHP